MKNMKSNAVAKDEWLDEQTRVRTYVDTMLADAKNDVAQGKTLIDGKKYFAQKRYKNGI